MKRRIIKLAPQVPAWCDAKNNIYLSSNGKRSRELKDGCDMKAINKGIKAGLLLLEEIEDEVVKKVEVPKDEPVAIEVKAEPVQNIVEKAKAKAKKTAAKVEEPIAESAVVEEVKEKEDDK